MALVHWGFIYTAAGMGSEPKTTVVDTGPCRTVLIGLASPAEAVEVAARLVDEGAQLIELCGAFGPLWTAKIIEAVGGRVPVGAVSYGSEAIDHLHAIFAEIGVSNSSMGIDIGEASV